MTDLYKQAVCSSLRIALDLFLKLQDTSSDRAAIRAAGRKVEDLTSVLDQIDRDERRAA